MPPPSSRPCSSRSRAAGPLDEGVRLAEMDGGERAGEDPELHDLHPEQDREHEQEERVDLPGAAEDRHRACREHERAEHPEHEQDQPGDEVEPARAVEQHELHVAPRVAEAVQLRLADARVVVDRDLAHAELAAERLEHHLRGELHPGRVQVERRERVAAHRPHAAVRVGDLDAEEDVQEPGEDRVADVAVEPRHRLAVDRPLEPRAHDEVVAVGEAVDERGEVLDRIRLVGIAHHDVVALRDGEPREVGAAVAGALLADDRRAVLGGDLRRAVGRGVVDDDHLAVRPERRIPSQRLVDDRAHRLLLVQAGDDDGDLGRCSSGHRARRSTVARGPVENRSKTPWRASSPGRLCTDFGDRDRAEGRERLMVSGCRR